MATTAPLTENSHQVFEPEKPDCISLEGKLSQSLRQGYKHVYDETPVGLVVYVRNDPVNLIDPDGRDPVSPWGENWNGEQWVTFVVADYNPFRTRNRQNRGSLLRAALGLLSFDQRVNRGLDTIERRLSPQDISSDCVGLLSTLSIDPDKFRYTVASLNFDNGLEDMRRLDDPTISSDPSHAVWAHAWLAKHNLPPDATIQQVFQANPGLGAISIPTGSSVFLRGNSGANPATMGHETLHKFNNLDDQRIQALLGLTVNENDTSNITAEFKKKCLN